jgi:hypothetical protein
MTSGQHARCQIHFGMDDRGDLTTTKAGLQFYFFRVWRKKLSRSLSLALLTENNDSSWIAPVDVLNLTEISLGAPDNGQNEATHLPTTPLSLATKIWPKGPSGTFLIFIH